MTWWCAATGTPWTWAWRAYPGVWLFMLLVALGAWRWGQLGRAPAARQRYFLLGAALLWIALDWPLGALGGYLAAAHAGQYLLLALSAPAFLLLGLRDALDTRVTANGAADRVLRFLAHPAPAFLGYNLILLVTHFPDVVDALMASQAGSFVLDMAWLAGGLFLWWPVCAPIRYQRLKAPLQMGYLFVQTIPATLPSAFLVFADYPLFRLYELSPRVDGALTPMYDHQIAGLLMKIVGDPIVWVGIAVIFFRWAGAERRADLASSRP